MQVNIGQLLSSLSLSSCLAGRVRRPLSLLEEDD